MLEGHEFESWLCARFQLSANAHTERERMMARAAATQWESSMGFPGPGFGLASPRSGDCRHLGE